MLEKSFHTVCTPRQCSGCMMCIDICSKGAIKVVDELDAYNAVIDQELCINCGACERLCPNNNHIHTTEPQHWYQGWAKEVSVRQTSSSGGIATSLALSFVKNGGIVCSCLFKDGEFVFDFATSRNDVLKFRGSKYVKSNPRGIYQKIKKCLKEGTRVLFIGLPCQVAALNSFIPQNNNLYTVDLICHGSPSPELLKMFLLESHHDPCKIDEIYFRKKTNFVITIDDNGIVPSVVRDRYMLAFLDSLDYTENCYSCQFASTSRCADITLGDAWGSTLPWDEQQRGISLVLCQSDKGAELLDSADIHLEKVDVEKAIENNRQLKAPSSKHIKRDSFFKHLKNKNNFKQAVAKCYPIVCLRQDVKSVLVHLGIIKNS